jgi:hypothetical protein
MQQLIHLSAAARAGANPRGGKVTLLVHRGLAIKVSERRLTMRSTVALSFLLLLAVVAMAACSGHTTTESEVGTVEQALYYPYYCGSLEQYRNNITGACQLYHAIGVEGTAACLGEDCFGTPRDFDDQGYYYDPTHFNQSDIGAMQLPDRNNEQGPNQAFPGRLLAFHDVGTWTVRPKASSPGDWCILTYPPDAQGDNPTILNLDPTNNIPVRCKAELMFGGHMYTWHFASNPKNTCLVWAECKEVDTDGDGIPGDGVDGLPNGQDRCPETRAGDIVDNDGCSIDQLCPCDHGWSNHGGYVSCVSNASYDFLAVGLITEVQKDAIVSAAAHSACGDTTTGAKSRLQGRDRTH